MANADLPDLSALEPGASAVDRRVRRVRDRVAGAFQSACQPEAARGRVAAGRRVCPTGSRAHRRRVSAPMSLDALARRGACDDGGVGVPGLRRVEIHAAGRERLARVRIGHTRRSRRSAATGSPQSSARRSAHGTSRAAGLRTSFTTRRPRRSARSRAPRPRERSSGTRPPASPSSTTPRWTSRRPRASSSGTGEYSRRRGLRRTRPATRRRSHERDGVGAAHGRRAPTGGMLDAPRHRRPDPRAAMPSQRIRANASRRAPPCRRPWTPSSARGAVPDRTRAVGSARRVLAARNPLLSLSLPGALSLRFDARQLLELLFQLPPRNTRFVPLNRSSPPLHYLNSGTNASTPDR